MVTCFFMRCTNRTEPICIQKNLFGESKLSFPFLTPVEPGNLGVLYNWDSNKLIGPWKAVSKVGTYEKNAWNENQFGDSTVSFEAQIKVEPLWPKLYWIDDYPNKLNHVKGVIIKRTEKGEFYPAKNVCTTNHISDAILNLFQDKAREEGTVSNTPPITNSPLTNDKNQTLLDLNNNYPDLFYSIANDSTEDFINKAAHVSVTISEYARKRGLLEKLQATINSLKNSRH